MDNEEQAVAYASADFSSSNQMFVDKLLEDYRPILKNVLDIGCGPGDVPIRLAKAKPSIEITKAVKDAGLTRQIKIIKGHVPGLVLKNHSYDAILSKDLLHHLPDPMVFWEQVKCLAKAEMVVYVMDLSRPQTKERARDIVQSVSGQEHPLLKQDFYDSLLAAFTVDEIRAQLREASLALEAAQVSERHLLVKGLIRGWTNQ